MHNADFSSRDQSPVVGQGVDTAPWNTQNPHAGFGVQILNTGIGSDPDHPGATGQRYFTIQRVNGSGANGKVDAVPGTHRHNIAESDRVKKNSVQRLIMSKQKEEKQKEVRAAFFLFSACTLRICDHQCAEA